MRTADPILSQIPPEVVHQTDSVGAWYVPGDGPDLVVTFGGVGLNPEGQPPIEFVGTAHQGGKNHVLAINDMKRTWYSQPDVLTAIRDIFARITDRVGPARVHGLGNSMGGYGAILFARDMGMATSLAFVPQFSMRRDVVNETRWSIYRPAFGEALAESLQEAVLAAPGTTWILHGALGLDVRQYTMFPVNERVRHAIFPRSKHGIARELKAAGRLSPFVEAVFAGDEKAARSIVAASKPQWRDLGTQAEIDEILAARSKLIAQRAAYKAEKRERRSRA